MPFWFEVVLKCQDTAEKLFTGVNATADKFLGSVSNTGD
jgi:hypothetical protein